MKKVYRYEIDLGIYLGKINPGPYTAYCNLETNVGTNRVLLYNISNLLCKKHLQETHPCIRSEVNMHSDFYCGCDSIKGLKSWFKGFNPMLLRNGFNLVEYEVRNYIEGQSGKQVVFKAMHIINKKILK